MYHFEYYNLTIHLPLLRKRWIWSVINLLQHFILLSKMGCSQIMSQMEREHEKWCTCFLLTFSILLTNLIHSSRSNSSDIGRNGSICIQWMNSVLPPNQVEYSTLSDQTIPTALWSANGEGYLESSVVICQYLHREQESQQFSVRHYKLIVFSLVRWSYLQSCH